MATTANNILRKAAKMATGIGTALFFLLCGADNETMATGAFVAFKVFALAGFSLFMAVGQRISGASDADGEQVQKR